MTLTKVKKCNVCIIGAGPAGLAALSALREPFSLDTLNDSQLERAHRNSIYKKLDICVVDPHKDWMAQWNEQFDTLQIDFLRSPSMVHPDSFDQNSLVAFAMQHNREDELLESGLGDIRSLIPLGQSQVGLWKLPSTKLFHDFCNDLKDRLPHDYIKASVEAIQETPINCNEFVVQLDNGTLLHAKAVILALGMIGHPIIPKSLRQVPSERIMPWTELRNSSIKSNERILVVGGGLTAIQAAEYLLSDNNSNVILCSRRPLQERHFDLQLEWFDRRTATKCMADFYEGLTEEARLKLIREARGGGSIPSIYMECLSKANLKCLVGNPKLISDTDEPNAMLQVEIANQVYEFDKIILACGKEPDCKANPLMKSILETIPGLKVAGGFPRLNQELQWHHPNLFVVGGMASLIVGPDGGNLTGMKRAARVLANELECREWMYETDVLANRFEGFWSDSDSDEESSDNGDESIHL